MKHAKFRKLLDRTGDLPTLPDVAQRVIALIRDPSTDARTLTDVIQLDPLIAARLLRLANSAYYRPAGARDVSDVHRAVVVLGFATIRNVVLAACLRSLYSPAFRTNHFTASDLWVHSVMVAVTSRLIAENTHPEHAEEAFTAGLVHDVGMIVEWNLFPELFPRVLARYMGTGRDFLEAEREVLGFDHPMAGAALLRRWGVPRAIRDAASFHHRNPPPTREGHNLPVIVQAAELLCAARGDGFFDLLENGLTARAALATAGVPEEHYPALREAAEAELEQARALLDL